jgi:hypothetical protein
MDGAAPTSAQGRRLTEISILILILTLGGLIVRGVSTRHDATAPGTLTLHSVRDTREILRAARQFFAEGGWTFLTRSGDAVSFSYELRPSPAPLVLLLLLGVVPGLIYLATARKTLRISVSSTADGAGSATRVSWSNNLACERACRDFAGMIRDQEPERRAGRPRRTVRRRRRVAGVAGSSEPGPLDRA